MQNNTRVEKPLGDRTNFLTSGDFSEFGATKESGIVIEHRASSATSFSADSDGSPRVQNVFSPRDHAKKDHIAWAYFKACVVGFAVSIIFISILGGTDGQFTFTSRLFVNLASGLVMMTIAPLMVVPIRILCDICHFFSVKRGMSDVLVGSLFGSGMMLLNIFIGNPTLMTSFGFILGGAAGGFAYWRYRGYPQTGDQKEISGEPAAVVQRF